MADHQDYLENYQFDWDMLNVVINGRSAFDSPTFLGKVINKNMSSSFLEGYGTYIDDPIKKAELFGNFQEALQFIKRYFLKEGNKESGLDLVIPNSILMISDVAQLTLILESNDDEYDENTKSWADIILKVVHTILHVDKDLRSNYFKIIQTQIFDKFYRYMNRNSSNKLFLGVGGSCEIPLIEFDTKSKKTRDSVILKLLHKAENVAEELFDRVGVRFIASSKIDCLKIINFLINQNVIVPQNIKPSRSNNSMVDLEKFQKSFPSIVELARKNNLREDRFSDALERELEEELFPESRSDNIHSLDSYRAIQFTCRQLVRYEDPFVSEFKKLKSFINKNHSSDEVHQMINKIDTSNLARDIEFFYPYEVQVIDEKSNKNNLQGDASHKEYKKSQIISARNRLFRKLI
jgi:uncharacterized protein (TIGR04562 family)